MICGTKHKIKNKEGFAVICRDTTIKASTEVRYLGVNLDDTLSGEGILDNCQEMFRQNKISLQAGQMFPKGSKKDPLPITGPEPPRLCYILMVCCYVTES